MGWDDIIRWPGLCGASRIRNQDLFWDYQAVFNSSIPDVPPCFQVTLITWIWCGFLWVLFPFYLIYYYTQRQNVLFGHKTKLNILKISVAALLCVVALADLIRTFTENTGAPLSRPLALYLDPFIRAITYVIFIILSHLLFSLGVHSSGGLFCFWLLQVLLNIIQFRSWITRGQENNGQITDTFRFVTFYISYGLAVVSLILECLPDALPGRDRIKSSGSKDMDERTFLLGEPRKELVEKQEPNLPPCPEIRATFLSRISYSWVLPILILGYRRPLVFSDLPDTWLKDRATRVAKVFAGVWHNKLARVQKTSSLFKALVKTTPGPIALAALYRMLGSLLEFSNPWLLSMMINWVSDYSRMYWEGFAIAIIMFCFNFLKAVFYNMSYKYAAVTAFRIRSASLTSVYRKAMRLSSSARKHTTTGELINLLSVDTEILYSFAHHVHELWAAPLMFIGAIYLLWQVVGVSTLAGLAFLLIVAFINGGVFGRNYERLQGQQMEHKDLRMKRTSEMLNAIKVLKLYAWEPFFAETIRDARKDELHCIRRLGYNGTGIQLSWFAAPVMVPLCIFISYILSSEDESLNAYTAFVTLNLTGILNQSTRLLPLVMVFAIQAYTSCARIAEMLFFGEIDSSAVERRSIRPAISIKEGTFAWASKDDDFLLKNINLDVEEGSLVAIVGSVGCGKSSLMLSMLGEMAKLRGSINVKRSTAYVPQQAWIQNATLKGNILFGRPLNSDKYEEIIDACALRDDLKIFTAGDQTEIGEKGINLSGGQKQRVSLARSVYQDEDIYLLDDPLSAVDAHVGKHIFEHVVGPRGLLRHKTRVFVTHNLKYLPECDRIVVMRNGEVSEVGEYKNLLKQNGAFAQFLRQYLSDLLLDDDDDDAFKETEEEIIQQLALTPEGANIAKEFHESIEVKKERRKSRAASRTKSMDLEEEKKEPSASSTLVKEEEAQVGQIKWSVVKNYVLSATITACCTTFIFQLIFVGSVVGTNIWVSDWADEPSINGSQPDANLRLGVMAGLGGIQIIGIFGTSLAIYVGGVLASEKLHNQLLSCIIRAPMAFFETTPLGRIINRFSADLEDVDLKIPQFIEEWSYNVSELLATVITICYSTPAFVIVAIVFTILYFIIQRIYATTVRQMKRINNIRKSPIYISLDETLTGVTSVRAYRREQDFIERNDRMVDNYNRITYPILMAECWMKFSLDTIGVLIIFFAALLAVFFRDQITGGLAGLSINYAMQTSWCLSMLIRSATELETHIVAAERVMEYSELTPEAPLKVEGYTPPTLWPTQGVIAFNDYSTRYRPGLDLVLKNLTLRIRQGEKVGVVGRTGAGKSSVTLSLFRIIEAASGMITIDGLNISKLGLHDLRSRLTIIPQDPALFAASIRLNLDPLRAYNDDQIWVALEHAHLKSFVQSLQAGLDYDVGEGGEALSVGQKQLMCLARALLRKSQILILDEATAAVDIETDELIQATIRKVFAASTVITIAHRLNTIMDYDRVLVLDKGQILEFDKPSVLLNDEKSTFYSMAHAGNL